MTTDELLKQAKALAPAEKRELVEALMSELDRPDAGVDAAWAEEAEGRLAAYRKGQIRAIPLAEVLAKRKAGIQTGAEAFSEWLSDADERAFRTL